MNTIPKEHVLSEIRRIAAINGDQPPGKRVFGKETGLPRSSWEGVYWSKWSDALAEAGFSPNLKKVKIETTEIFPMLVLACRHFGRRPSLADLQLFRRNFNSEFPISPIRKRLGVNQLWKDFDEWLISKGTSYQDVIALLPSTEDRLNVVGDKNPPSGPSSEGYVYLLQSGGFYKIGRSDDIERRVKEVRTQMPSSLELIHTIRTDDPSGIERYWHERFRELRANGEWFKLSVKEIKAFKRRKFQ